MVLVDSALNPKSCWEFEGDILVLHHPTTISCKYQAMGEQRGGAMGGPHCRGGGVMGEQRGGAMGGPHCRGGGAMGEQRGGAMGGPHCRGGGAMGGPHCRGGGATG